MRIQEGEVHPDLIAQEVCARKPSFFMWTQTWGLAHSIGSDEARQDMLDVLLQAGIPTVAFHLDRWWGLNREHQVVEEPFFRCNYVFTADGGHDENWQSLGINHIWLPPAVYHAEAIDGTRQPRYVADVVFVGSWRHYGHEEWWPTRKSMLDTLRSRYGRRFKTFPTAAAIRGMDLTNLYASCKVAVGDSCLVGSPERYWSDRVPETLGRGAVLVHPDVEGLQDVHPEIPTFTPGDFDGMVAVVDDLLREAERRENLRQFLSGYTREHNTYRNRMESIIRIVKEGWI